MKEKPSRHHANTCQQGGETGEGRGAPNTTIIIGSTARPAGFVSVRTSHRVSAHLDMERARRRGRALLDLDLELDGVLALLRLGERDRLRESRQPPTPRCGRTCTVL